MVNRRAESREGRDASASHGISKLGRKLIPIREKILQSGKTYTRDEILERIHRQRAGE